MGELIEMTKDLRPVFSCLLALSSLCFLSLSSRRWTLTSVSQDSLKNECKRKKMRERGEGRGGMVKKKKKNWAHINEFTAGAAQSSSRGWPQNWGMCVCACVCARERVKERERKTMWVRSFTWEVNKDDAHACKRILANCLVKGSRTAVSLPETTLVRRGKMFFLEELITQHPPKHRTHTLARTHNVTTARVWIQSGRFHRQASPFVLNLHTVASGPIDRGEGRERQGGLGV